MREGLRPIEMDADEIEALLALDVPAHLATTDDQGRPIVIPIWFLWTGEEFVMTSVAHRPHVRRLEARPVASLCVDVEGPERQDGQRPNRQVRASGTVALSIDEDGFWTRRITEKYLHGPGRDEQVALRSADRRVVMRLKPERLIAVRSV
jgi:nitroimidazol reductase NimA-like FMN-containing flavoprotein (pyridoxamine 5'-phosphate oxidase superfamily)